MAASIVVQTCRRRERGARNFRALSLCFAWLAVSLVGYAQEPVTKDSVSEDWQCVTSAPGWVGRSGHMSAVFHGKLWIMGGVYYIGGLSQTACARDVWCSEDGITWTQAVSEAPWHGRAYAGMAVFQDKLWLLGGYWATLGSSSHLSDVWSSGDGVTWTLATGSAAWGKRSHAAVAVFDDRLWVLGGKTSSESCTNDVWYSWDGAEWFEATAAVPWGGLRLICGF